jgi:hypothetical protein
MQSDSTTKREESLKVVSNNGSILIVLRELPVLQGVERNGRAYLQFTASSGIRSNVELVGPPPTDEFLLSGTGIFQLGQLTLSDATVQVTPSSLQMSTRVTWSDKSFALTFECAGTASNWRAQLEARESLGCLLTRPEILRVAVTMELDTRVDGGECLILAVLDGRNIEVSLRIASLDEAEGIVALLRTRTLAAVRKYLLEELDRAEADFAAVNDQAGCEPATPISAPRPHAPATWAAAPSQPAVGYLPAARQVRGEPSTAKNAVAGYLDHRFASATSNSGYLPRPSRVLAGGYIPAMRQSVVRYTRDVALHRGGEAWPRKAEVDPANAPESLGSRSDSRGEMPSAATNSLIDFERIAYAVLRCKDLLQAIESAEKTGESA